MDAADPSAVPFASAWSSPTLDGGIWAQPLVYNGLVIVATEADGVYALNEATGQVVWHKSVATPVPATQLPCGDITPTVGITSTPVIDPAANEVFVVADTWDGVHSSSIAHELFALNLSDGSVVSGFPVAVDPPGTDHTALLQRSALALSAGKVFFGYGGNDGDCGVYNGWLGGLSESGGSPSFYEVAANQTGGAGAIWGSGDGPAVDASGDLWLETGNGFGAAYGGQESVLKFNPSSLALMDHWAPANWAYLDANDIDLGSGDPLLLPGGLAFVIGKQGVGYLLSTATLGGTGAPPVYSAQVCGRTTDASFGGAVYYQGIIYATCADGLRALTLNTASRTFTPVSGWQVWSAAIGPPIVAGGLVWVAGWDSQQLFGLNPQTGAITVDQTGLPAMKHFATPAASDGKLFLATGQTVQADTVAAPRPAVTHVRPSSGPAGGGTLVTITGSGFAAGDRVVIGQGNGSGAGAIAATGVSVVSSTQITATTGGGARTGTWNVFVIAPDGTVSAAVNGDAFTYTPAVSRVSPTSGSAGGGTLVTITGSGFAAGDRVVIGQGNGSGAGAIAATGVSVVSSTQITATTGGGARTGTWNVFVIAPDGTVSAAVNGDAFTYTN